MAIGGLGVQRRASWTDMCNTTGAKEFPGLTGQEFTRAERSPGVKKEKDVKLFETHVPEQLC